MRRILLFLALIVPGSLRLAHAQDTTFMPAGEATPPVLQQCPKVTGLSRHGTVLVETIVDTLGRAEPEATKIITSPDDSLSTLALRVALDCQFTPARIKGHAVRALARVPVNFSDSRTRQDTTFVTERDAPPVVQQCPKVTGLSRHGTVLVETIVDTLGRAEPRATKIITSPDDSLSTVALRVVLDCQFTPARIKGHAVRALAHVPLNF